MPITKVNEDELLDRLTDVFRTYGYEGASLSKISISKKGQIYFFDEGYLSIRATLPEQAKHYGTWGRGPIPEGEWEQILEAIQRGQLTGNERFVEEVARKIGRRVERQGRGRPRKEIEK